MIFTGGSAPSISPQRTHPGHHLDDTDVSGLPLQSLSQDAVLFDAMTGHESCQRRVSGPCPADFDDEVLGRGAIVRAIF
jgi:hypothetical protein